MNQGPVGQPDIEIRLRARTHGQVRELAVEQIEDSIVIRGHARTYYAKQLAQHGAMDLCDGRPIINRIIVG